MTGSRSILESQAILQIVEFWNLQIHLCSTLSVKAGLSRIVVAKDCTSDTNHGSPFGNGFEIIVAHPH